MDSNTTVIEALNTMTIGNVAEVINGIAIGIAISVAVMFAVFMIVEMFSKPKF